MTMTAEEIRITFRNLDDGDCPEVRLEFYCDERCYFATFVSSLLKNGIYNEVGIKIDLDGDGKRDTDDILLLTRLAQAAAPLLKVAP
ncbi:hypothetical protein ACLK1G_11510 [Pseudomonas sp. NR3]|uniref:hypothetical protein n=1 Tax=Pseudomonas sp. NR3 TaxID=3155978 RepID=UPI003B6777F1